MNINLFETFQVVVKEGSALQASKALDCTQSNVSARIRQLENELGAPLFDRQGKRLVLNDVGYRLLRYVSPIMSLIKEAKREVSGIVCSSLKIGTMESTATMHLPSIVSTIKRKYPDYVLDVKIGNEANLTDDLLKGKLDVALTAVMDMKSDINYLPIFNEDMTLITACNKQRKQLFDEETITLLAFNEGCPYRAKAESWIKKRAIHIGKIISFSSYSSMISCVAAGMGYALTPKNLIKEAVKKKQINYFDFSDLDPITTYLLTRKSTSNAVEIQTLIKILRGYAD